jgi:hypothetical protein
MPDPVLEAAPIEPPGVIAAIEQTAHPIVFRGLARHWPAVAAGSESGPAALAYVRRFYRDATVGAMLGEPVIRGRFFYNETLDGFNFNSVRLRLDSILDALERHQDDPLPPAIYVGSTTVETCLPGFRAENDLPLEAWQPLVSVWLGNRARIAAHQDVPDNLACVAAGRRRFTLFPPEQLENLYVGPLDFTPAGQAISLVDFEQPDASRFPRFAFTQRHAQVAELAPGDAIYIPSLWWHHVESLEPVNVLVNYWWRRSPAWMDTPVTALMLAMLSVRDLPAAERAAWHGIFRHYVFDADDATSAHVPPQARSLLSPLDAAAARRLRAQLLKRLNR